MMNTGQVVTAMLEYNVGDVRRIEHLLKVYAYAKAIGEGEGLDEHTQGILEIAAITHDIGIKNSEKKYGSSSGKYQEMEGPDEARKLLAPMGLDKEDIERIAYLIGHHHSYESIDGLDYQILVEADFLVNLSEEKSKKSTIDQVEKRVFKTATGIDYLHKIFSKIS